MCDVEIACCHLVKHRSEQEKVLAANEHYLDIAVFSQRLLEMQGSIQAAEAAAEDQNFHWFHSRSSVRINAKLDNRQISTKNSKKIME